MTMPWEDRQRRERQLAKARAEVEALSRYYVPGHPWTGICGPVRGNHAWCEHRIAEARARVEELTGGAS